WHRAKNLSQERLQMGEGGGLLFRFSSRCAMETRLQQWPVNFRTLRHDRQVSQVSVYYRGTHQVRDLRCLRTRSVLTRTRSSVLLSLFCPVSLGEQRHCDAKQAKHRGN